MEVTTKKKKPVIGITIGDLNGIGIEVIIKSLEDTRIIKQFTPVIYGSGKCISFYKKLLQMDRFRYQQVNSLDRLHPNKVNVLNVWSEGVEINPGKPNGRGGKYARISLEAATNDIKKKRIDAITTAPLSKEILQDKGFTFPGHTEYLSEVDKAGDNLMFLIHDQLKVGVVTGHIPLHEVSTKVTKERVNSKLRILIRSMQTDFGIKKPRVAVLGLNPHSGENGLLGREEIETIGPVIDQFRSSHHLVFGPFPSDGFFGTGMFKNYDAVLAMYHDQGLAPFKTIAFEEGVNYTAGLSFVRTSPVHGTAFSIAGKNRADPTSFRNALYAAKDILNWRNPGVFSLK